MPIVRQRYTRCAARGLPPPPSPAAPRRPYAEQPAAAVAAATRRASVASPGSPQDGAWQLVKRLQARLPTAALCEERSRERRSDGLPSSSEWRYTERLRLMRCYRRLRTRGFG